MVQQFFLSLSLAAFLILKANALAVSSPAIVFDPYNDMVLYAEDPDMHWHPASLTKIMTAYVTFEALKSGKITLDSEVTCSAYANRQPPTRIGLPVGGTMTVRLALETLIVKSANDVAVMLAEKVGGTEREFVKQMNKTAKRLHMWRTRFVNPNGLPDARQVTSARDMGLLARAILRDFPEYAHFFATQSVNVGKRNLLSYNSLLRTFKGADGMKTGFICASGYNVVASATRNGQKLVAVVLGARSTSLRSQRVTRLLEHGFRNYDWKAFLFSDDIDTLESAGSLTKGPVNLRNVICTGRPKPKTRRKIRKKKRKRRKRRKRRR